LPLPAEEGEEVAAAPLAADGGPEARAELADLRSALVRELLRLPPRYRAAIVLRFVEGLSYPEIAQATGRPLGTVKSDIHRAALLMRPALRRWYDGAEEGLDHAL
jgi:RNA polymerase sigma-70 factor (ECF subfamily)